MYSDTWMVVCLFISLDISPCISLDTLGPANIVVERIDLCEDPEKYPVENNLIMKKINRTTAGFTGCIRSPVDLGPSSSVQIDMAKWGDGGWKPNAYNHKQQDVCETAQKYVKESLEEVLKFNGFKNEGCPLKKNNYCIENFIASLGSIVPSALYGKFRMDAIVLVDSKPIFCLRGVIISSPNLPGWSKPK